MPSKSADLLSRRINNLTESETIQMASLSRELKNKGIDVIDLSLGEPDFGTPDHIKAGAKIAIDEGDTHYTPVPGIPALRKAIVEKFKRDNDLEYDVDQIMVSTGAKQSLSNVILSILNPGDEVVLPTPYWVSYTAMIELAEGIINKVQSTVDNDFKITPAQLDKAITPKTKIFLYSSPCNPSGSVFSKEELRDFAEVLRDHEDIIIVADEIYEYLNYTDHHESMAQFDFIKDRVVVVNGVSKGFAMTGWRVGYLAAPQWLTKACDKMQGQVTSGTCSIAQRAALTALTSDMTPTYEMKEKFLNRRNLIIELLKGIPNINTSIPMGAIYIFPDVSYYFGKSNTTFTINDANDFCMYMLQVANVAMVTGKAFGVNECVRLSYSISEDKLREAVERIKKALSDLK